MAAEFARIGVGFERVTAVDGANRSDFAAISPGLSPSEVACFLSHKACWSIIAEGEDAYGAIFEDDIVLSDSAGPLLVDAGWIPADAQIIKLETFFKKAVIAMKRASIGHGFSVARLHGLHVGAAGYILSKQAARDLIDATQNFETPVDHVIFDPALATSSSKTIYQLLPALCIQDQFMSEKATGLPSLLSPERLVRSAANVPPKRTKTKKLTTKVMHIWRQIFDVCRLRREKTIPFSRSMPGT